MIKQIGENQTLADVGFLANTTNKNISQRLQRSLVASSEALKEARRHSKTSS